MGDAVTFLTVKRKEIDHRPVSERVHDYHEVGILHEDAQTREQASRCLKCFLPFCHWSCPVGNYVPEWNDHLANGRWEDAFRVLQSTNNMPEVTGRICPAPCEAACVLGMQNDAVTNRDNEWAIMERAFREGFVRPHPPARRTGKTVAVVGSGPAGLSCADQLNKAGHQVVVFERDDRIGGILRYGIPDFKLDKQVLDRRLALWSAEGIQFVTGINVGAEKPVASLLDEFDAVCVAGGSRLPRDLAIEGRDLKGIHMAMEYLTQSNRRVAGARIAASQLIDAKGKRVVVIGGGDTGADCVGTAHRQGAARVVQIELLPRPPEQRNPGDCWPDYPTILRTSTSHEEGGTRDWCVLTKQFLGQGGRVTKLACVKVEFVPPKPGERQGMREIPGTAFEIEADLVLLAMGFVSPEPQGLLKDLGVGLDARGNVATDAQYQTSVKGVFAAGDMRRGQSLVVWAIIDGRRAAHAIDQYLMGHSELPAI